ncbi:MAG: hypothetical protein US76_03210 [Parcubacteria group bacterium GW2011_GWA2_38_13b]|nr:MAG: hypothetical protein US76_03210 [Parcubacteria group bacterium GW2011_GWA2_38_13b]
MKPFLSVIIPAYNESKRIIHTLLDVDRYLSSEKFKKLTQQHNDDRDARGYEILVVDDGSKDNTVEVVKKFQSIIKNLKIIENQVNHGKGFAVRQGMIKARGKLRLFTDADNSTSIDHIEKMIPCFYGQGDDNVKYSIIIGSRVVRGAEIPVHQPLYKEILGKLGNKFIQLVAVPGIVDTQCGFKCFTDKAARSVFTRGVIDGWAFDIEILAIARLLRCYKIKEVPVKWINDPESRVTLKAYFQVLLETIKIRINIWRGLYK